MEPLSRLLPATLHKLGIAHHVAAAVTVHRAQQWLNERLPDLESRFHVDKIDGDALVISCDHALVAQELHGQTADLLSALEAQDGQKPKRVRIIRSNRLANGSNAA